MLNTSEFFYSLYKQGYTHLCVVPCSFSKDLINEALNNSKLIHYTPCASESVACSVAAGLKMAGKKPIVIVQSSGLTNMASCITSLLVPYKLTFPIIVSWRTYELGDSEIQHQHLSIKLPDLINAYGYDYEILDQKSINKAVMQINNSDLGNSICVLNKNTFSQVALKTELQLDLSNFLPRSSYLNLLNNFFNNEELVFIGTTGNTSREMYSFMPDTDNFYMAGNMGGALSVGLGMSLAGRKVVVCGGDAEFVMHMGGLTTSGRYSQDIDLMYILFDNESNKSTGGQDTYQKHVDYLQIAQSSGFKVNFSEISNIDPFHKALITFQDIGGLNFLHVKCAYDKNFPRPPLEKVIRNKV
jgi:sulfopyruvate decarboxylase TPP-binding subunit